MSIDRLFVLWSDPRPEDGTRCVIGSLWRRDKEFYFAYGADLSDAKRRGFSLLPEFPEHRDEDRPYRSRHLFATFAQRLPQPARPDVELMLASWGLAKSDLDDPFLVLARSGGRLMTDRLELAEYRPPEDPLTDPLVFRIAGQRYYGAEREVQEGAALELRREPANAHDPQAVGVWLPANGQVGHIPRQYSALLSRLLDAGVELEAVALRRVVTSSEVGRWVLRVRRA